MNRLLKIFSKCEQDIHKRFGNNADLLEAKGPPRWSPETWGWVEQRVSLFEEVAEWATPQEKQTVRSWLGGSVEEYNAKDAVVRACFEHVVATVDRFLNEKGHN
jgi:hypothetical protein